MSNGILLLEQNRKSSALHIIASETTRQCLFCAQPQPQPQQQQQQQQNYYKQKHNNKRNCKSCQVSKEDTKYKQKNNKTIVCDDKKRIRKCQYLPR